MRDERRERERETERSMLSELHSSVGYPPDISHTKSDDIRLMAAVNALAVVPVGHNVFRTAAPAAVR